MRFAAQTTPIEGLMLLTRQQVGDHRGAFSRLFCADQLNKLGWPNGVMQSNYSQNAEPSTVRGLHFQHPPYAEAKLVTCVNGAVFDVAVDLRAGSNSFGRWFGAELTPQNGHSLLIPQGFAHGFQVLKPDTSMVYFHSENYLPEAEGGVRYDDPSLAINWPLPVANVSARDQSLPDLHGAVGEGTNL